MSPPQAPIFIVGDPGEVHVGAHLAAAADRLGLPARLVDSRQAYGGAALRRRALWWAWRRPAGLADFSRRLVEQVRAERPGVVITTGLAPVTADALARIGDTGARRLNFLTDDPWNPAHRSEWFLRALPHYDCVCSPRSAIRNDLLAAGVKRVERLWFAYNPEVHYHEPAGSLDERRRFDWDVLVAGGGDRDRVAMLGPLLASGVTVGLYGGYWSRFGPTRRHAQGVLDAVGLRRATSTARVAIGLVRRANRDDHAMRTFEVPAMRGCLLAERTSAHEELFGQDNAAVRYFDSPDSLAEATLRLLAEPDERQRMADGAQALITRGRHTYADRLLTMLEWARQ